MPEVKFRKDPETGTNLGPGQVTEPPQEQPPEPEPVPEPETREVYTYRSYETYRYKVQVRVQAIIFMPAWWQYIYQDVLETKTTTWEEYSDKPGEKFNVREYVHKEVGPEYVGATTWFGITPGTGWDVVPGTTIMVGVRIPDHSLDKTEKVSTRKETIPGSGGGTGGREPAGQPSSPATQPSQPQGGQATTQDGGAFDAGDPSFTPTRSPATGGQGVSGGIENRTFKVEGFDDPTNPDDTVSTVSSWKDFKTPGVVLQENTPLTDEQAKVFGLPTTYSDG